MQSWAQDAENNGFPAPVQRGSRSLAWHRWADVYAWLCRTGRAVCEDELDETDPLRDLAGVAAHFGVAVVTVKMWRSRSDTTKFPVPDTTIGRSPHWRTSTLNNWQRPTRHRKASPT